MEANERFRLVATATPEVLALIDEVLEGKALPKRTEVEAPNCRLISVADACRMLNMTYPTFHRAMQEGCFDVVHATGKTWIKELSVIEFADGKRKPSAEGLAARAERNRRRRLARQNAAQGC